MTLAEVKLKIRTILNETGSEDSFSLISVDTVKLDDYIKSVIPDAVRFVTSQNIPDLYLPVESVSSATVNSEDGCSVVAVPSNFMRFLSCRFSGWKREVQEIGDNEAYKANHNPITRAGVNKPECVYANTSSGKVIECFPSGTLSYFRYVKSVSIPTNDSEELSVSDRILESICYAAAYLVYSIFENVTAAEAMKKISLELLPNE